ncbi:hypothetical protein C8C89_3821 [Janthinobacterium sp. 75]|nr:hypothetical protein C8C89_3821 [Janthinobacterium sp. 75]
MNQASCACNEQGQRHKLNLPAHTNGKLANMKIRGTL